MRYLKLAGITKAYSPRSLRHTFATQLLNAGASLEVVKELMGHRSLDVTLRYTQLYDHTKRSQYDQAMAQVERRHGLEGREATSSVHWQYNAFVRSGRSPPTEPAAPPAACAPPDSLACKTDRERSREVGHHRHSARVSGGLHALVDPCPERRPEDG